MVRIKAPDGKKIRDIRTEQQHTEVITEENKRRFFVLADGEGDPIIETIDGVTLDERVSDLEDAVIELAEIITEGV